MHDVDCKMTVRFRLMALAKIVEVPRAFLTNNALNYCIVYMFAVNKELFKIKD